MDYQSQKRLYMAQHRTVGCKVTHMFGIPMIYASLVVVFFNFWLGIALFGFGWVLQFSGHAFFEKNKPVFLSDPKNPFTYIAALVFAGQEWWKLITRGTLKDDDK